MRGSLLSQELLVSVEHDVQVELLLQQHKAMMAEALDGAHRCYLTHPALIQPFDEISDEKQGSWHHSPPVLIRTAVMHTLAIAGIS